MNSKKLLSILLIVCMLFSIMPTAAFADETTPEIWVGGIGMVDGDYLAESAASTVQKSPVSTDDNYAYYKDGVLTLHNYDYEGAGYQYGSYNDSFAIIYAPGNLTIELKGSNCLVEKNDKKCDGIHAIGAVTVTGEGSIEIDVDGDGIESGLYDSPANTILENANVIIDAGNFGIMPSGVLQSQAEN